MSGSVVVRVIATFLLLLAISALVLTIGSRTLIEHTIHNSRIIQREFDKTESLISEFGNQNGRLPTDDELQTLIERTNKFNYSPTIFPSGYDDCDSNPNDFATAPKGSYVLGIWRGEWMECYAPTSGKTTVTFTTKDYTLFGSFLADEIAAIILATLCLLGAVRLWVKRRWFSRISIG